MSQYWMLEVREESGLNRATIGQLPDLRQSSKGGFLNWLAGRRICEEIPRPLLFHLDPKSGGDITDFFPNSIPLMSQRMLTALSETGVENVDSYEAILLDRKGDPVAEAFLAVNIVGRIACADLDASDCELDDPSDPVGVDFNSLVIDEQRAAGNLLFRLHEAPNGIVVHDVVRRALEPLRLRGIVFIRPEDWIG